MFSHSDWRNSPVHCKTAKTKFLIIPLFSLLMLSGFIFNIHAQEQNENIRVEDPTFTSQQFRTGETISNPIIVIIIESLGAILIVLFIIVYAIKKRKSKGVSE